VIAHHSILDGCSLSLLDAPPKTPHILIRGLGCPECHLALPTTRRDFAVALCGSCINRVNMTGWLDQCSELGCPAEEKCREAVLGKLGQRDPGALPLYNQETRTNALQAETLRIRMLGMGRFPSNVCSSSLFPLVDLADSPALARGPLITRAAQAMNQGSFFVRRISR
jgi:hypothetical protein